MDERNAISNDLRNVNQDIFNRLHSERTNRPNKTPHIITTGRKPHNIGEFMFFIPETKELIAAKIREINEHVNSVGADKINHYYAQSLIEAYYTFDDK